MKMPSKYIEYIENTNDKEFLKVMDSLINKLKIFGSKKQKRRIFFFFGNITNTEKWYIYESPTYGLIVYQQRLDKSLSGIPFTDFSKALESALVLKFTDVPLEQSEVKNMCMDYIMNIKHAEEIDREKLGKLKKLSYSSNSNLN